MLALSSRPLCSFRFSRRSDRAPAPGSTQHVAHRVQARLRPGDEARCPQRASGEGAAGEGAVGYLDLLAVRVEDHAVLADDGAAAQGVDADLTLFARRAALAPVDRDLVEILLSPLRGGPRQEERCTRRGVRLVPVVRLDDLDIVICPELLGELADHLPDQAHPDAHVRGEDDGRALRRFLDPRELLFREARRPDDDWFAVGQVLDSRLGLCKLDQGLRLVRWVLHRDDARLAPPAQFAEVGAELRGPWLDDAAGEFERIIFERGTYDLSPHSARRADHGYARYRAGHTSSGVGRRWAERSRVSCRRRRFSPSIGTSGRRISSEQRPSREAAVFTGMGLVSTKRALKRGRSSRPRSQSPSSKALTMSQTAPGATLEATEITPRPPRAIRGSVIGSSPERTSNSSPQRLITSLIMFIERVESLTPTMLGISARRAIVSAEIATPVRPGMLYRTRGRSVLSAIAAKCLYSPSWVGLL